MKATATVVLVFLFLFPASAYSQTSEEQIERLFHAGQQALQKGQFEQAVDDFKKVLALDPNLVEAQVNLGLAYQSLFDYELAVRSLGKALHDRPNLVGPTVIVGMDYLKLGSPQKGIPFLQQALKLDPTNENAREALATCYLSQENFRSAAEEFRQIASFDSDKADAFFKLGHEYLDLAARLAYRGAHLYSESAWGHRFLGDLLYQRDRWDDALKEYQKALSSDPQETGLHTSLGQTYLQMKKLEDAEKEFRLDLQLDARNERAWLGLANAQLAGNQAKAALASIEKIWEISPEFLQVEREFPSIELSQESAKSLIANAQEQTEGPAKHFVLAGLCVVANDRACADGAWNKFQGEVAASAQTMQTAAAPCQSHQYSRCSESLKAKKTLSGSERLLLGKTYFTLQQYEAAADSLAQVQGVNKENAEASYWLSRSYQALATDAYARLQESFPNSWRACQMRAEAAGIHGNMSEAVKEFHAALQVNPNEPELHEAVGEFYLKNRVDNAVAQSELETALAIDPVRTHALYLLGLLFIQDKENEKALPYLQRAVRLQPNLMEANSLLGTAYLRLGKFADAVPCLERATPSDHYGNVHYQLSIAYKKLGRAELSQKELALSRELRKSYLEHDEAVIMGAPQQPEPEQ